MFAQFTPDFDANIYMWMEVMGFFLFTHWSYYTIFHSSAECFQANMQPLSPGPLLLTWFNFNPSMDK